MGKIRVLNFMASEWEVMSCHTRFEECARTSPGLGREHEVNIQVMRRLPYHLSSKVEGTGICICQPYLEVHWTILDKEEVRQ